MLKLCITTLLLFATVSHSQTLTLNEAAFDFGDIDNLKPAVRDVEFKNTGDKELIIDNIKASCGCSAGKLEKNNYQPNESGKVSVTFNPKGRSGKQTKTLTFISNDAQNKTLSLNFTANVVPVYEILPNRLDFSFKEDGAGYVETEKKFSVVNKWNNPIIVESVRSQNDNVTVTGSTGMEVAPGKSAEYTAKVKVDFIPENHVYSQIYFTFKIDDESIPQGLQLVISPPLKKVHN